MSDIAARVLVVDDEVVLTEAVSRAMRSEGWEVRTANRGKDALQIAQDFRPDAVVLDIMMPDLDGMEVLARLRRDGASVPVLFLTAKDAVTDRIDGFAAGGDDYVTKPFGLEEVIARVHALLRRSRVPAEGSLIQLGDLSLDEDSHEVLRAGESIQLTATEFRVLRYFMRNPRRVLSKAQILEHVWGYDFGDGSTVLEMYISYLRRKVDAGHEPMLHTIRGAGYILKPGS